MPKGYWMVSYRSISNPEALAQYAKLSVPAVQSAGGRLLVRGVPATVYEAGINERSVLIEFDSVQAAIAAYESPAYQAALKVLEGAAERDIRIVEGLP